MDNKTLNENLTKIAFSMKPGDVSNVVELAGSYYLLYVEAKQGGSTKSMAEVHDDIENKLLEAHRQEQQTKWLAGLRKKAYIWIDGVTNNDGTAQTEPSQTEPAQAESTQADTTQAQH